MVRSTKAGAETPATPDPESGVLPLAHGRSTKAGAETPATPLRIEAPLILQEPRSTKAGAETPATRDRYRRHEADGRRSTKAGAETPATPCAVRGNLRAGRRSTKAGAETPATPRWPPSPRHGLPSLNEGRGRDPGDTANRRGTPSWTQLGTRSADA